MFSEETKQKVVQKLNENVDIPIIDLTEEKIIEEATTVEETSFERNSFQGAVIKENKG